MRSELSSGLRQRLLRSFAKKQIASERLLSEYVKRLSQEVPKSTILLFGSRARGDSLPYSDYDIAVILEHVDDKVKVVERLRRLKPKGLSLDLIVVSIDELNDPIIKEMLRDSKVLYDGLGLSKQEKRNATP